MPIEPAYQIAFVVDDIERAAMQWHEQTGAGPFFVIPHFGFLDARYLGEPSNLDISIALGYSGDLMVELIVCHNEEPSPFYYLATQPKPALHHVAQLSDNFDATIARYSTTGSAIVFTAAFPPSTRMAYIDTRVRLGCFTEVIEMKPDLLGMQAAMRSATKDWNGDNILRSF